MRGTKDMATILLKAQMDTFVVYLAEAEKSETTIRKYIRDIKKFYTYAKEGTEITKQLIVDYKDFLAGQYQLTSANSMLAALNCFLEYIGCRDCRVRAFKIQRQLCRSRERNLTKQEYLNLLHAAKRRKQEWLYLAMLTICATGIRVSELPCITTEGLSTRRAKVYLKGKSRVVILPAELCHKLRRYTKSRGIRSGSIFVTKNGKPIDRSNILHAMKKLCKEADVEPEKVFPHNLRHLFAVTYYEKEHNITHLADILGHSNINTTRIYTLISLEEQERQIQDLGLIPMVS